MISAKRLYLTPLLKASSLTLDVITRAVNHKMNRLHERWLTALLETSTFNDMLSKSNEYYYSCKRYSKTDDWIVLYGSHNEKVFTKRFLKYDLRNYRVTLLPNTKTKNYGTDTIAYRAAQFCIKFAIVKFIQIRNKKLTLYDCPYNICRIFVGSEGFIIWN